MTAKRLPLTLLCILPVFLVACGALEIGIVPPTDIAQTAPAKTLTPPTASPTPQLETSITPTPYIDHWTDTPFPAFGIVLERPLDWEVDAEYSTPETGDTKYAGVNGFVHVAAIGATSLDEAVAAEAEHHLRPYGSQPIIENIRVGGQEARLYGAPTARGWFMAIALPRNGPVCGSCRCRARRSRSITWVWAAIPSEAPTGAGWPSRAWARMDC